MAQFLRPDSNITLSAFTGGFAEIDESTPSDLDFAYGDNNTQAVLEVGLSDPIGVPDPSGISVVRYRIAKTNNGVVTGTGSAVTITPQVYQGGSLVQSGASQSTTGIWTEYSFTFTHESITDWSDLRIRFSTSNSGGSPQNRRGGAISWAEVESPDSLQRRYVLVT